MLGCSIPGCEVDPIEEAKNLYCREHFEEQKKQCNNAMCVSESIEGEDFCETCLESINNSKHGTAQEAVDEVFSV